ncbi:MAG: UbiA family prenyltransferase [Actinomycetota bacterium]
MTPPAPLTASDPFPRRFRAYLRERFPLGTHLSMVVIYFLANQFLAQRLLQPDAPLVIGPFTALGMLFLLCMFFHLRVFDEHKDANLDLRHYPDRLLSRGVITLAELRTVAAAAIAIELLSGLLSSPAALLAVVISLFFSWVLLREFFVPAWLRARFMLYAVAHMLIMPMLTATIFSFTTGRPFWEAPWLFWAYALADFFAFANWEISRKIRLPEDELPGVDTYSRHLGIRGSLRALHLLRLLNTLLAWLVGWCLELGPAYAIAVLLMAGLASIGIVRFTRQPDRARAAQLEHYGGGYILLFYLVLAVALWQQQGF